MEAEGEQTAAAAAAAAPPQPAKASRAVGAPDWLDQGIVFTEEEQEEEAAAAAEVPQEEAPLMPEEPYQPSEVSVPASAPASSTTTPEATESELQPAVATDTERSGIQEQAETEDEEEEAPQQPAAASEPPHRHRNTMKRTGRVCGRNGVKDN